MFHITRTIHSLNCSKIHLNLSSPVFQFGIYFVWIIQHVFHFVLFHLLHLIEFFFLILNRKKNLILYWKITFCICNVENCKMHTILNETQIDCLSKTIIFEYFYTFETEKHIFQTVFFPIQTLSSYAPDWCQTK